MPIRSRRLLAWLLLVVSFTAAPATAVQQGEASSKLYVRVEGETVRAAIETRISPGWHLYHVDKGPADAVGKELSIEPSGARSPCSAKNFTARSSKEMAMRNRFAGSSGLRSTPAKIAA